MAANVKDISDQDFEKSVLQASQPVLLDFWAEWCAPCRALSPIVEDLATQYHGKVQFFKMNIDQNQQTPVRFGVRGIPTLILFKDGKVVDQVVGVVPKAQIESTLAKAL